MARRRVAEAPQPEPSEVDTAAREEQIVAAIQPVIDGRRGITEDDFELLDELEEIQTEHDTHLKITLCLLPDAASHEYERWRFRDIEKWSPTP